MIRIVRWSMFLLVMLAITAAAGFAQTSTSRISGTVTDPSGAVVPGATVTATNEATGVAQTQVSSEGGLFSFPSMTPGKYTIKVELTGFKTAENIGNILESTPP